MVRDLAITFAEHARINDEMHAEQIKSYLETSNGAELPDYLKNPFNISRALCQMCKAIAYLEGWRE